MYEVHVSDDFMVDGLAIYLSQKVSPDKRRLLQFGGDFSQFWSEVSPDTVIQPTMRIPGELARALLEALLRHYEGASDMHTARADLLHERGRVDRLTAAMVEIVTRRAS